MTLTLPLFEDLFLDLVDPLLVPSVLLFEAAVIVIEAAVLYFMLERTTSKAVIASFSANLVTGLLSLVYLLLPTETLPAFTRLATMIILALPVNIILEAGVLKGFYRAAILKLLKVSVVMNIVSYAILILSFLYLFTP